MNVERDTSIEAEAAMWLALGQQTKLSKSGFSPVFVPELRLHGRADLSGDATLAEAQLVHAGIDVDAVTPEQLEAFIAWRAAKDRAHALDGARIVVTTPFSAAKSAHQLALFTVVKLVDGGSNILGYERIECVDRWESDRRNRMGGMGAFVASPNYARIEKAIATLRKQHPDFADAPLIDNNVAA